MSQPSLSSITVDLIATYGQSARNLVQAYRHAGERVTHYLDQSWDQAIARSAVQLGDEVRTNATAAQRKFVGLYSKGVELGSNGADAFIGKVVELADQGVQQAAANASRFQQATGVKALDQIARAAVPAALAVGKVVTALEARTGELAERVAPQKTTSAAKPFQKARAARKAA